MAFTKKLHLVAKGTMEEYRADSDNTNRPESDLESKFFSWAKIQSQFSQQNNEQT